MFVQKERDIWKFYAETPRKIQKDEMMEGGKGENRQNVASRKMVFYLKTGKHMGYLEFDVVFALRTG